MRKLNIMMLVLAVSANAFAQLSTGEQPLSFDSGIGKILERGAPIPTMTMPELDMARIEKEDMAEEGKEIPPRFGYSHKVNFNPYNSGIWRDLPNGDRLWQLRVVCPNALSVNFLFDRFWLPEGGKLFVYSSDHKQSIGAFTSRNNKGDNVNLRGFATGLVFGSDVVLEYYQPGAVTADAVISAASVVHGYRYVNNLRDTGYGQSGVCQVNVNCAEGQPWQREKNAVALIVVDGDRLATGSMVNTTDLGQKPFLLTANHCLGTYEDAEENPILDYYSFYWGYETPGCINGIYEPRYFCTNGATVVANNNLSDFALLRLSEDPQDIGYNPFYLGWDCSGLSGDAGVCIHHPSCDAKKISSVDSHPQSVAYYEYTGSTSETHWLVRWKATQNGHGTTENGSSGSPLLNSTHKLIGQLHGGKSSCYFESLDSADFYGKISVSWTSEGNTSTYRRLNCWLDSLGTGQTTLEGLLVINSMIVMDSDEQLYSNIRITGTGYLIIQGDVEIMGNGIVIVESGCTLIIDGGSLTNAEIVLKPGSTLRIINGGIIETRNGFDAPVGAVVSIEQGQII